MSINRRHFITRTGLAAGAALSLPSIIPSRVLGERAPSKRITLGCIGMGSQGVHMNLKMFLREDDAQVVAVCDAYKSRAQAAAGIVDRHYVTDDCVDTAQLGVDAPDVCPVEVEGTGRIPVGRMTDVPVAF